MLIFQPKNHIIIFDIKNHCARTATTFLYFVLNHKNLFKITVAGWIEQTKFKANEDIN